MSNVIARRKDGYVSNIDYTHDTRYNPLNFADFDLSGNTYKDFISGNVKTYEQKFPDDTDIYISDAGVYLPSQFCNELNRDYKGFVSFMALSRHFGCNVHINVQNLNRCYDKIREQSDTYLYCRGCIVLFGFVFQRVTEYELYDTALSRMRPPRVRIPLFNTIARSQARTYLDQYRNTHGAIRDHLLIYRHKSSYDTRYFKTLLAPKAEEEAL